MLTENVQMYTLVDDILSCGSCLVELFLQAYGHEDMCTQKHYIEGVRVEMMVKWRGRKSMSCVRDAAVFLVLFQHSLAHKRHVRFRLQTYHRLA